MHTVPNRRLRLVLRQSLATLVRELSVEEAAKLGRSEAGVLNLLGPALMARARPELVRVLVGGHHNPVVDEAVGHEMDALAKRIERDGFNALLRFGPLLQRAITRATKPLTRLALAQLEESAGRRALLADLDALSAHVAAQMLAGQADEGLLAVIVERASQRVALHLRQGAR